MRRERRLEKGSQSTPCAAEFRDDGTTDQMEKSVGREGGGGQEQVTENKIQWRRWRSK
jgi:hypothetical protein